MGLSQDFRDGCKLIGGAILVMAVLGLGSYKLTEKNLHDMQENGCYRVVNGDVFYITNNGKPVERY